MKVEITKAQLIAIMEMADNTEAGIGMADAESTYDIDSRKHVRLIDRFLSKNGYRRDFTQQTNKD